VGPVPPACMEVPFEFWPPPEWLEIVGAGAFRGFSLLWLQAAKAATIAKERAVRLMSPSNSGCHA